MVLFPRAIVAGEPRLIVNAKVPRAMGQCTHPQVGDGKAQKKMGMAQGKRAKRTARGTRHEHETRLTMLSRALAEMVSGRAEETMSLKRENEREWRHLTNGACPHSEGPFLFLPDNSILRAWQETMFFVVLSYGDTIVHHSDDCDTDAHLQAQKHEGTVSSITSGCTPRRPIFPMGQYALGSTKLTGKRQKHRNYKIDRLDKRTK